jgi:carbonic anhydrase
LNYPALSSVPFYKTHHTIQVQVSEVNATNSLQFGGNTYTLAQFHFHAPAEHRIDDEYFPLEAHFVHATKNGKIIGSLSFLFRTNLEKLCKLRMSDSS